MHAVEEIKARREILVSIHILSLDFLVNEAHLTMKFLLRLPEISWSLPS